MIDFEKGNGLVPAIVQDANDNQVLMLGYLSKESWQQTLDSKKVCFYSRSKERLWTKGESSGNYLHLKSYEIDCDQDTLLLKVVPEGPVCHKGTDTCFGDKTAEGFIRQLDEVVKDRVENLPEGSYTTSLLKKGINKVAQKVGEEAVELVIEAKDDNKHLFLNEAADLLYHYLVLLRAKGFSLSEVEAILKERHGQ